MTHVGGTTRNLAVLVGAVLVLAISALALKPERAVYTFGGPKSGAVGGTHLVADSAGNLYGTTLSGGNNSASCGAVTGVSGCGVVFKLAPRAHGAWEERVLYTFTGGEDGAVPVGGVILDSSGNLYGTTWYGGNTQPANCHAAGFVPGCGVVFKLTPTAHGPWQETVLYTFTGGSDGSLPFAGVILDSNGNLYGTTTFYGNQCCGVVFRLTPTDQGPWTETVLYSFTGHADGSAPYGGLTFDPQGNLYGVTLYGGDTSVLCYGTSGCGVVFKLTPTGQGPWTETVLHAFTDGADGANTLMGVTLDSHGNVYGTTLFGGDSTANNCRGEDGIGAPPGCGVVFGLKHGTWEETVLYTFTGGSDGAFSGNPVIFDAAGNLYGSTENGGDLSAPCVFGKTENVGCGVVFKLKPVAHGPWTESVLYTFAGGADGGIPESNLLPGPAGSILGITQGGGNTSECTGNFEGEAGCAVVFGLK